MGDYTYIPVTAAATIANGASQSAAVDIAGKIVKEIIVPTSGWSGANMTLLSSNDNATFYPVYETDGTEATITIGVLSADRAIRIPTGDLDLGRYLKLRSGTVASPQNCTGCAIVVVMRPAA
jgi:hypothetical protein